ncbi:MAG: SAM-dependent methyltransferase [Acidimicrobiales bacterium]
MPVVFEWRVAGSVGRESTREKVIVESEGWNERYQGADLVWGRGANQFLVEEASGLDPGRALDVACGEGRNAIWLAERGWVATGVDFSSVGLEKAARLAAERGVDVTWVEADVVSWEPTAAYDLIVVMYLHLPAAERRAVHRRLSASLSAGGTLLVVGHDRTNLTDGYGGPQDPEILLTPEEVAADLSTLDVVRSARVERHVATDDGEKRAIDTLVRATKAAPAALR